ncbi:lipopolysaccharide kinase InaA family protein [Flavobacterium sp.]|uniref:lipopolysaccharide kinase InaA family protein n=1 Tax=Flavobacterium sp. TaxID=239 RepID=UPI00286E741C|nr:lipopolysaccharide kinase InaA family protein [Flavobacterium sp.]
MKFTISPIHKQNSAFLQNCIANFDTSGIDFIKGARNSIKLFEHNEMVYNIKSFRKPNAFNQIVYRFFRQSKAKRSFDYASILLQKNIGTPEPIAYFEKYNLLGLQQSYYVCQHIEADLTFTNLNTTPDFPNHEQILREFAQFSFQLHENGIEFLDHSQGNTLIKKNGNGNYDFYLVDLNRMKFHQSMDLGLRMKNLCRLTPKRYMVEIMSQEYAKLFREDYQVVFDKMWLYVQKFQMKFQKKHADVAYKGE